LSFAFLTFYYRFGFTIGMVDFVNEYNNTINTFHNIISFLASIFTNNKLIIRENQIHQQFIPFDELRI